MAFTKTFKYINISRYLLLGSYTKRKIWCCSFSHTHTQRHAHICLLLCVFLYKWWPSRFTHHFHFVGLPVSVCVNLSQCLSWLLLTTSEHYHLPVCVFVCSSVCGCILLMHSSVFAVLIISVCDSPSLISSSLIRFLSESLLVCTVLCLFIFAISPSPLVLISNYLIPSTNSHFPLPISQCQQQSCVALIHVHSFDVLKEVTDMHWM